MDQAPYFGRVIGKTRLFAARNHAIGRRHALQLLVFFDLIADASRFTASDFTTWAMRALSTTGVATATAPSANACPLNTARAETIIAYLVDMKTSS
jgi:hypothetical protein